MVAARIFFAPFRLGTPRQLFPNGPVPPDLFLSPVALAKRASSPFSVAENRLGVDIPSYGREATSEIPISAIWANEASFVARNAGVAREADAQGARPCQISS